MRIRQQAAFFADLSQIEPKSKEIVSIMEGFADADMDMIPSTFHEMIASEMQTRPRLLLSDEDQGLAIQVGMRRLDIIRTVESLDDRGLGEDMSEFADIGCRCCNIIIRDKRILGHRLSLITQDISRELDDEQFQTIFKKIINPASFYEDFEPSEWTVRLNSKTGIFFADRNEDCNNITKLERSQGLYGQIDNRQRFDRIFIEFDINTSGENIEPRFNPEDFSKYLHAAGERASQIRGDLVALTGDFWGP